MLKISKKFLFYSMIIISSTSLVNMITLYWFPMQIPLSSYSVTCFMFSAYFFKAYFLIPICFVICALMFFAAFSFLKEQIIIPIALLIYLLCDLFHLAYSFFDTWFNDAHFISVQAIQMVISITVMTFLYIYFVTRNKAGKH